VVAGIKKMVGDKKTSDEKLTDATAKLEADEKLVKDVTQKLVDSQYLDSDAGRAGLARGLDRLIKEGSSPVVTALSRAAEDVSSAGRDAGSQMTRAYSLAARLNSAQAQIVRYQALLSQSRKPEDMLDLWMALLQERGPDNE